MLDWFVNLWTGLGNWLPWIIAALFAGCLNLPVAYQKLYRDCRSPLFNPWKSLGFYFWVIMQIALPALVFWLVAREAGKVPTHAPEKATVELATYFWAAAIGFFFTVFVNANADLGFFNFPMDKFYAFVTKLAYDRIAAEETGRWTRFEIALLDQLKTSSATLERGLLGLRRYFINDNAYKNDESERQKRLDECDRARNETNLDQQLDAILALLIHIRRQDLRDRLRDFGCSDAFLTQSLS
ncbi:MAG: hypothetical protein VKJ24_09095 [Synechococcales bacterium]|nr:hypothetical protein [Synechococcales bacterium]